MAEDRWPELCKLVEKDDGLKTWDQASPWTREKLYFWYRNVCTNTAESYFGRVKRRVNGVFLHASAIKDRCVPVGDARSARYAKDLDKLVKRLLGWLKEPEKKQRKKAA